MPPPLAFFHAINLALSLDARALRFTRDLIDMEWIRRMARAAQAPTRPKNHWNRP